VRRTPPPLIWCRDGLGPPSQISDLVQRDRRAIDAGRYHRCRFREGDAANLHQVPDQAFDFVVKAPSAR
jgi:hypothetical protein